MKHWWLGLLVWFCAGLSAEAADCPNLKSPQPRWAQGFSFKSGPGWHLLTVKQAWAGAQESQQYLFLKPGCAAPDWAQGLRPIPLPPKRLVALSTTYLPLLVILDQQDRLVATTEFAYVNTPEVKELIEQGGIQEIGFEVESELEQLVALEPDLILSFGLSSRIARSQQVLARLDLNLLISGAHLEPSPLGRAEWILVLGALFGVQDKAQEHMRRVSAEYLALAERARKIPDKPRVFVGSEFKGIWYIPGGRTYQARLVADAGGDYLWKDHPAGHSVNMDFEAVLAQAVTAEVWLNPGQWRDLSVARQERRFGGFGPVKNGRVYNYVNRLNGQGGNDYWESGSAYPNRVLKDLVKLLHPELLPEHELYWYKRLQ